MAIIAEFVLNFHDWKSFFFFVQIDNAFMEDSCIPILRTRWGRKGSFDWLTLVLMISNLTHLFSRFVVTNPLPPTLDDLYTIRDILRDGPLFWATFTPKWVRRSPPLSISAGFASQRRGRIEYGRVHSAQGSHRKEGVEDP